MHYTAIKHSVHFRRLKKCRKYSPAARVFYISFVFSNTRRVLSHFNIQFKVDRLQIIVVAKNIIVLQLFISRMPKMCAIPQLVSASLNPIPTVEHFRRSHPQCEHSYGQHGQSSSIVLSPHASLVKIDHVSSRYLAISKGQSALLQ